MSDADPSCGIQFHESDLFCIYIEFKKVPREDDGAEKTGSVRQDEWKQLKSFSLARGFAFLRMGCAPLHTTTSRSVNYLGPPPTSSFVIQNSLHLKFVNREEREKVYSV